MCLIKWASKGKRRFLKLGTFKKKIVGLLINLEEG